MKRANYPLSAHVTDDGVITIEIGINVNAHAALRSDFAWTMADEKTGNPGVVRPVELFRITDAKTFAREIVEALADEEEDGSTMLSRVFDEAARTAIENGSESFEEIGTPA